MIFPRLGERQETQTSWIVNARTAKGDPVLKLDRDCDGQVQPTDAVLVARPSPDSKEWRPVANLDQLQAALAHPRQVGLWTDKRNFLVLPPDGKPQPGEVQTLSDLWSQNRFHRVEFDSVKKYGGAAEYTGYFYVQTDPTGVHLGTADSPAGPVATFNEPQITSKVNIDHVTLFVQDGNNWVPMSQRRYTYEPGKDVVIS